jgi:hypothetical protein
MFNGTVLRYQLQTVRAELLEIGLDQMDAIEHDRALLPPRARRARQPQD